MVTSSPTSVLCVDDEPRMANLIATSLERLDDKIETTTATAADEALEVLNRTAVAVSSPITTCPASLVWSF